MTPDREAFIAKINECPDELTAKLVYADWLQENGYELEAMFWRGEAYMTRAQFSRCIIAQDADDDYSVSGYVAGVFPTDGADVAFLVRYSHCSCYGTWEALTDCGDGDWGGTPPRTFRVDWIGTPEQLIGMAMRRADPVLPSRTVHRDDCDVDHLERVYAQVLAWANAGAKVEFPRCGKPQTDCQCRQCSQFMC